MQVGLEFRNRKPSNFSYLLCAHLRQYLQDENTSLIVVQRSQCVTASAGPGACWKTNDVGAAAELPDDARPPAYVQESHIRTARTVREDGLFVPTWLAGTSGSPADRPAHF